MTQLPLCVDGNLIGTTPIALLLGARKKIAAFVDLPSLERWLAALPVNDVSRQLQQHLCEFLKRKCAALRAAEIRSQPIIVGEKLDSTDHFRKDASTGAARLSPEVIDVVARVGRIDLFVRPHAIWDEGTAPMRQMTIDLRNYSPKLLQSMHRGNPEVLTGPQMVQRYPDSPLIQRKLMPARVSVENGRVVTIPAKPQRFAWE